jgi:hypothetical protein
MLLYYCKNEKDYYKVIKDISNVTEMEYDEFCEIFKFIVCKKHEYDYENCDDCPKYDDCCLNDIIDEDFVVEELEEEYPVIIIYNNDNYPNDGKLEIHSLNQLKQNTKYI